MRPRANRRTRVARTGRAPREQARRTLDQSRRRPLYAEATQIIHDERPWLELFQEVIVCGVARA